MKFTSKYEKNIYRFGKRGKARYIGIKAFSWTKESEPQEKNYEKFFVCLRVITKFTNI